MVREASQIKLPRLYPILDTAPVARLDLHVGQEDLPPAAAHRILGPHRVLGFSTHNTAQLAFGDCQEVDYLAVDALLERVREWDNAVA